MQNSTHASDTNGDLIHEGSLVTLEALPEWVYESFPENDLQFLDSAITRPHKIVRIDRKGAVFIEIEGNDTLGGYHCFVLRMNPSDVMLFKTAASLSDQPS